jgi:hypothetical protein
MKLELKQSRREREMNEIDLTRRHMVADCDSEEVMQRRRMKTDSMCFKFIVDLRGYMVLTAD